MAVDEYDYEVTGEVIKMIHGQYPAVRWDCGRCGDYTATIFEPGQSEKIVQCESCEAVNLVRVA